MTLDPSNFDYPMRRYGMDHDRYDWSLLQNRPKIDWGNGKKIALWVNVAVEVFPLNDQGKPFKLPGSVMKPYPDIQTYTWRDYGNRVGIYRMMRLFDRFSIRPTWAVNGAVADEIPGLIKDIATRGEEVIAHGYDMASPHYGGQDKTEEAALIERTLSALSPYCREPIKGWMSPGKSQSHNTPDLLAKAGIAYMCDWPNDDMPYRFNTASTPLVAMPHSTDLDDRKIIIDFKHHESEFVTQVKDQYLYLSREAAQDGARVLSINLHPWVIGQSHRASYLKEILEFFASKDDVWIASGTAILTDWGEQTGFRDALGAK